MTILQLFQETFSDPSMYGYMGVGSGTIITMLVNKALSKKKDTVNIMRLKTQYERDYTGNKRKIKIRYS